MSDAGDFAFEVMSHALLKSCLSELAVKDKSLLPEDYHGAFDTKQQVVKKGLNRCSFEVSASDADAKLPPNANVNPDGNAMTNVRRRMSKFRQQTETNLTSIVPGQGAAGITMPVRRMSTALGKRMSVAPGGPASVPLGKRMSVAPGGSASKRMSLAGCTGGGRACVVAAVEASQKRNIENDRTKRLLSRCAVRKRSRNQSMEVREPDAQDVSHHENRPSLLSSVLCPSVSTLICVLCRFAVIVQLLGPL